MNRYWTSLMAKFLLLTISIISVLPFIILVSGSITDEQELLTYLGGALEIGNETNLVLFPSFPTLRGYVKLLLDTPEFYVVFWNSVKITVFITLGQLLIAVPAAWGFSRWHGKISSILFYAYTILMLLPFQVTMLSGYIVLDRLKLLDTHSALILPAIFSTFPIFIMYRFFSEIPSETIEAFSLDSNSRLLLFRHIAIPLAMPGIKASILLGVVEYWNMIEQPLIYIKTASLWPFSVYLPQMSTDSVQYIFVFSFLVLVPMLLVTVWGKDDLESGIGTMIVRK